MSEDQSTLILNAEIDRMLGIEQPEPTPHSEIPDELKNAVSAARVLNETSFLSEIHPQPRLRALWLSESIRLSARSDKRQSRRTIWIWAVITAIVLIAGLVAFRQPVFAAVGRLFGYGYIPQVGFVQLDTAQVLRSPVKQEYRAQSLTVVSGLATPGDTKLWLEFSVEPTPSDSAWLETSSGDKLTLQNWGWDPDQPASRGVRLVFPPLPAGANKMVLALPEGWRIPLEWIPAAQANIPSAEFTAPYPTLQTQATQSTHKASNSCIQRDGLQVCLKAASADPQGTHVLLEASGQGSQITPGGARTLLAPNPLKNDLQIILTDDLGNIVPYPNQPFEPIQSEKDAVLQTLTFPAVSPQARTLTLRVPAIEAHSTLPSPLQLQVDLGQNPQPGQILTVDQGLEILGQVIHFNQATLEGDGVSSLRLTLVSDPADPKSSLLVAGFDLGRPDGIDDLYGSGSAKGRVKVTTELIGSKSGKKTGVLIFPILGANVLLLGPFEFSFPAPAPAPAAPTVTPQVVNGDSFTPQPTPTPLSLDSYLYQGRAIQSGDLLFAVVGAATTDLFAFNPASSTPPERIATLPGQVYQIFVHPDRQGIDYLSGTRVTEDNITYYRGIQIFTVRFDDIQPRLLATFPRGPENVRGTELADWSYDGRFMIFNLFIYAPRQGEAPGKLGWIDLNCRKTGNCQVQYLQIPDGIIAWGPQFSPSDYRVLMTGNYTRNSSYGFELFMLEFNSDGKVGEIANLSNTDQVDEQAPHWNPITGKVVALCPTDPSGAHRKFCFYDPVSRGRQEGEDIDQHLFDYQIEPDGNRILGVDLNHQAADNNTFMEFRLFDWNGKGGPLLASTSGVNRFEESPDSKYFAYNVNQTERMHLVDITKGSEFPVPGIDEASVVSWLEWIH